MSTLQEVQPTSSHRQPGAGLYLYATGSVAAGALDLIWRDFERAHQPIQALGDSTPHREVLACIAGLWLAASGAAILLRRFRRAGALGLANIYLIFALFWAPRLYTAIHYLGFTLQVVSGLLAGVGQQLILVAAAMIVHHAIVSSKDRFDSTPKASVFRWTFGVSSIAFGLAHLTDVAPVAAMIPKWIPPDGELWAIVTGAAFVAAGLAILSKVLDVLAARLLALMLLIFSVVVLARAPMARPHDHVAWGSNAYNLAAVGAVMIFAESLAAARRRGQYGGTGDANAHTDRAAQVREFI